METILLSYGSAEILAQQTEQTTECYPNTNVNNLIIKKTVRKALHKIVWHFMTSFMFLLRHYQWFQFYKQWLIFLLGLSAADFAL